VPSDSVLCRLCGERFRLITHTHLASRHRSGGERPTQAYKARYGKLWSDASLRAMSESLSAHYDRRGRKWTPERIVRQIRGLLRDGRSLRFRDVWRLRPELYWTAQRLFGSWAAALRSAAVPAGRLPRWPEWSRERVRGDIRRRAGSGKPLHWAAVNREEPALYWAAQRLFGSWKRSLAAAGVDPRKTGGRPLWTRDTVRAALGRRQREGRSLRSTDVRREHTALYKAALRVFGSWRAAIR
jgi:hypothetical protein